LGKHYKPLQVLEIVFTVANNNSTTRWTDGLGIPQESTGSLFGRNKEKKPSILSSFLTPTPEKYRSLESRVAPVADATRPALEPRKQVESAQASCRKRTARFPLADEQKARALLPDSWAKGPLPQWVRLLANFPVVGKSRILGLRAAEVKGALDRKLRAQLAWIAAREDRAWYALGQARKRLVALGVTEKDVWALDGPWDSFTASQRAAFALARKLTGTPQQVTDDDIALLRKHFPDQQVAELVYQVCNAAFFNRTTEAAGLRLEE
jgi:alkylhydroperoxidase family enzyme